MPPTQTPWSTGLPLTVAEYNNTCIRYSPSWPCTRLGSRFLSISRVPGYGFTRQRDDLLSHVFRYLYFFALRPSHFITRPAAPRAAALTASHPRSHPTSSSPLEARDLVCAFSPSSFRRARLRVVGFRCVRAHSGRTSSSCRWTPAAVGLTVQGSPWSVFLLTRSGTKCAHVPWHAVLAVNSPVLTLCHTLEVAVPKRLLVCVVATTVVIAFRASRALDLVAVWLPDAKRTPTAFT